MNTISEIEIELIENKKRKLVMEISNSGKKIFSERSTSPKIKFSIISSKKKEVYLDVSLYFGPSDLFLSLEMRGITIKLNNIGEKIIYWGVRVLGDHLTYLKIKRKTVAVDETTNKSLKVDTLNFMEYNKKASNKIFREFDLAIKLKKKYYEVKKYSKKPKDLMALVFSHIWKKATNKQEVQKTVEEPSKDKIRLDYIRAIPSSKSVQYGSYLLSNKKIEEDLSNSKKEYSEMFFYQFSSKLRLPTGEFLVSGGCSINNSPVERTILAFNYKQQRGYVVGVLPHCLKKHGAIIINGDIYIFNGYKDNDNPKHKPIYKINPLDFSCTTLPELDTKKNICLFGNSKKLIALEVGGKKMYTLLKDNKSWSNKDANLLQDALTVIPFKEERRRVFILKVVGASATMSVYILDYETEKILFHKSAQGMAHNRIFKFKTDKHIFFTDQGGRKIYRYDIESLISVDKKNAECSKYINPLLQIKVDQLDLFKDTNCYMFQGTNYDFRGIIGNGVYVEKDNLVEFVKNNKKEKIPGFEAIAGDMGFKSCYLPDGSIMVVTPSKDKLFNSTYIVTPTQIIPIESPSEKYVDFSLSYDQGMIYIVGQNVSGSYNDVAYIEAFDCLKGRWTLHHPLNRFIGENRSFAKNNKIYIFFENLQKKQKLLIYDLKESKPTIVDLKLKPINSFNDMKIRLVEDKIMIFPKFLKNKTHCFYEIFVFNEEKMKIWGQCKIPKNLQIYDIRYNGDEISLLYSTKSDGELTLSIFQNISTMVKKITQNSVNPNPKDKDIIILNKDDFKQIEFKEISLSNFDVLNFDLLLKHRYNRFRGLEKKHKQILVLADNKAFKYDTGLNNLIELKSDFKIPEECSTTQLDDGRIILTGGVFENGQFNDKIHIYNPFLQRWSFDVSQPQKKRRLHKTVLFDNKVLILGGYDEENNICIENEYICLESMRVYSFPQFKQRRAEFATIVMNNKLFVLHGVDEKEFLCSFEFFDKKSKDFSLVKNFKMEIRLKGHEAVKLSFNSIGLIGGVGPDGPNMKMTFLSLNSLFNDIVDNKVSNNLLLTECVNGNIITDSHEIFFIGGNHLDCSQKLPFKQTNTSLNLIHSATKLNRLSVIKKAKSVRASFLRLSTTTDSLHISQNQKHNYFYLFGTSSVQKIFRLHLPTLSAEIVPVPDNFKMADYSGAIAIPDGRIFYTGGQIPHPKGFSMKTYLLTPNNDGFSVETLPDIKNTRYTFGITTTSTHIYIVGGRTSGAVG